MSILSSHLQHQYFERTISSPYLLCDWKGREEEASKLYNQIQLFRQECSTRIAFFFIVAAKTFILHFHFFPERYCRVIITTVQIKVILNSITKIILLLTCIKSNKHCNSPYSVSWLDLVES